MIALDTNLLIYAHRGGMPEHGKAKVAITRAANSGQGWAIPYPCLVEFWSIVTHPAARRPSQPDEAQRFITALVDAGAKILLPGGKLPRELFHDAETLGVVGSRIFDLQIALIARSSGATEIWTHDSRFVPVPGLKVHDPL